MSALSLNQINCHFVNRKKLTDKHVAETHRTTGWHTKSGTYTPHVDQAIDQLWIHELTSIIALKGGHVEHMYTLGDLTF